MLLVWTKNGSKERCTLMVHNGNEKHLLFFLFKGGRARGRANLYSASVQNENKGNKNAALEQHFSAKSNKIFAVLRRIFRCNIFS